MSFSEICIYRAKPDKAEEFETLMAEVTAFMKRQEGVSLLRFMKREYTIRDMDIETREQYGAAQKNLYESYWKEIDEFLIMPHDKYLGEIMF